MDRLDDLLQERTQEARRQEVDGEPLREAASSSAPSEAQGTRNGHRPDREGGVGLARLGRGDQLGERQGKLKFHGARQENKKAGECDRKIKNHGARQGNEKLIERDRKIGHPWSVTGKMKNHGVRREK